MQLYEDIGDHYSAEVQNKNLVKIFADEFEGDPKRLFINKKLKKQKANESDLIKGGYL